MNRLALRRLSHQRAPAVPAGPSDLACLAGTWSQEEAESFQEAIGSMDQVDPDLWR
jgi:hypothetical protein